MGEGKTSQQRPVQLPFHKQERRSTRSETGQSIVRGILRAGVPSESGAKRGANREIGPARALPEAQQGNNSGGARRESLSHQIDPRAQINGKHRTLPAREPEAGLGRGTAAQHGDFLDAMGS